MVGGRHEALVSAQTQSLGPQGTGWGSSAQDRALPRRPGADAVGTCTGTGRGSCRAPSARLVGREVPCRWRVARGSKAHTHQVQAWPLLYSGPNVPRATAPPPPHPATGPQPALGLSRCSRPGWGGPGGAPPCSALSSAQLLGLLEDAVHGRDSVLVLDVEDLELRPGREKGQGHRGPSQGPGARNSTSTAWPPASGPPVPGPLASRLLSPALPPPASRLLPSFPPALPPPTLLPPALLPPALLPSCPRPSCPSALLPSRLLPPALPPPALLPPALPPRLCQSSRRCTAPAAFLTHGCPTLAEADCQAPPTQAC